MEGRTPSYDLQENTVEFRQLWVPRASAEASEQGLKQGTVIEREWPESTLGQLGGGMLLSITQKVPSRELQKCGKEALPAEEPQSPGYGKNQGNLN